MKYLNIQSLPILLFIIPLSFIAGIAVTEFFVFFCTIFFLIFNKDKFLFINQKVIFLFLFSAFVFANTYFRNSDDLKLGSIFYFRYVLFSLAIFFLCELLNNYKNKRYFFLLIFSLLVLLADSIFQFFLGFNIFGFDIISGRVSSFFHDELILGSYLVRILPIILWFMFFFRINLKKNIFLFVIFFSLYFITIYLSGGRTSFFLWIITVLGLLIIIKIQKNFIIFDNNFNIFISITSYFKLGKANTFNRIFVNTYNHITPIEIHNKKTEIITNNEKKKFNFYSTHHEGHILLALKLFDENEVFGIGPQGFKEYCRKVNHSPETGICSTHPHNILIQIILELGLIGLIFYIIAIVFILFNLFKSFLKREFNEDYLSFYAITLGLIINLFPLIPGGNFFNNWISIILYYNVGLYIYSYKNCIIK